MVQLLKWQLGTERVSFELKLTLIASAVWTGLLLPGLHPATSDSEVNGRLRISLFVRGFSCHIEVANFENNRAAPRVKQRSKYSQRCKQEKSAKS